MPGEQIQKIPLVEFLDVVGVDVPLPVPMVGLVRRGDQQPAVVAQHPAQLGHHGLVIVEVFDGLEADHEIEGRVGKGDLRRVAPHEADGLAAVALPGMGRRRRVEIHADNAFGDGSEQVRAVALAGGDIEDVLSGRQRHGHGIAMEMFRHCYVLPGRQQAFSRVVEWSFSFHADGVAVCA